MIYGYQTIIWTPLVLLYQLKNTKPMPSFSPNQNLLLLSHSLGLGKFLSLLNTLHPSYRQLPQHAPPVDLNLSRSFTTSDGEWINALSLKDPQNLFSKSQYKQNSFFLQRIYVLLQQLSITFSHTPRERERERVRV